MQARKRWITTARRDGGTWHVGAPRPVGEVGTLLRRLRDESGGAPVALGLDLPLGLPRGYVAAHRNEADFPSFLRALAGDAAWFQVCESLDEVAAGRPFYPHHARAGVTQAGHAAALGLAGPAALSRLCDRATAERPAGASLFWTLGPNQTGKAALAGWRDLLLAALVAGAAPPRLWPFEGDFHALLGRGGVVVAETYPAEAARHLGVRLRGSKQRRADRAGAAASVRAAMERLGAVADPPLRVALEEGFGPERGEDDGFDSLLGALCVLGVLNGDRPDGLPPALADDPWVRRWEGWVLGQTAVPARRDVDEVSHAAPDRPR